MSQPYADPARPLYELAINITIRPQGNYSQGLNIQETAIVSAHDFLECAQILGLFHALTLQVQDDAKKRGVPQK